MGFPDEGFLGRGEVGGDPGQNVSAVESEGRKGWQQLQVTVKRHGFKKESKN